MSHEVLRWAIAAVFTYAYAYALQDFERRPLSHVKLIMPPAWVASGAQIQIMLSFLAITLYYRDRDRDRTFTVTLVL